MISLESLLTDLEYNYLDHPAVVGRVRYLIGLLPYEGGHEWAALELPGLLDLCSLADQRLCSDAENALNET